MHVLQAQIRLLRALADLTLVQNPRIAIPPQIQQFGRQCPLSLAWKILPSHHSHNTKQKWQKVENAIIRETEVPKILTAGPGRPRIPET